MLSANTPPANDDQVHDLKSAPTANPISLPENSQPETMLAPAIPDSLPRECGLSPKLSKDNRTIKNTTARGGADIEKPPNDALRCLRTGFGISATGPQAANSAWIVSRM